jgi:hypothetical protein
VRSEALQQAAGSPAATEAGVTLQRAKPAPVGSLEAQLEAKLGRQLTSHEKAVLGTQAPQTILSDKFEMPAQAGQLLDIYRGCLSAFSLGRSVMYRTQPGQPLTGTDRWRLRAGKLASLCVLPLALLLLCWSFASQPALTPFLLSQGAVSFLAYLAMAAALWQHFDSLEKLSADRIAHAHLFERLMEDDEMFTNLYRHTPAPWRWICLGSPPRDLLNRAKLLAHYLDWFVAPPRPHFRWYWAQWALLVLGVPIVAVLAQLQGGTPGGHHGGFGQIFIAAGLTPTLISLGTLAHTKALYTSALIRELRERFAVPAAKP